MQNPLNLNRSAQHWRMLDWLLIALALAALVWWMAPQQLPVSVYKLSLVAMAAVAGYWIDRGLFPYARPDALMAAGQVRLADSAMRRRAIIVAATMLAVGLGA